MFAVSNFTDKDIKFILDNLCDKSVEELQIICGNNFYNIVFDKIKQSEDKILIKLKNDNQPVAIVGIIPLSKTNKSGALFFLSTDNLKKGCKMHLLKESRKYILKWLDTYNEIIDQCYNKNFIIMKWLKFLGFSEISKDENFNYYLLKG